MHIFHIIFTFPDQAEDDWWLQRDLPHICSGQIKRWGHFLDDELHCMTAPAKSPNLCFSHSATLIRAGGPTPLRQWRAQTTGNNPAEQMSALYLRQKVHEIVPRFQFRTKYIKVKVKSSIFNMKYCCVCQSGVGAARLQLALHQGHHRRYHHPSKM